jgi:ferredoxin
MCANVAPSVFELTDDGELQVLDAEVSADHVSAAREAADVCPVRALQILD